jgi:two-component system nitrate/nitrite response regulator NarL
MTAERARGARTRLVAAGDARNGDPIRILVAMQACLDREAIAALLRSQDDFRVLGTAGSGRETITLCARLHPRVLLLGALVPWPGNVSAIAAVRLCSPETQVVAIAPHAADRCADLNPNGLAADCCALPIPNGSCLLTALAHGARGALHRDVTPDELFQAVRIVAKGGQWIEAGVEAHSSRVNPLSRRERAVAIMVGGGSSNKDIARTLGITEATAKKHIGNTLRKLGLNDRLQLGLCVARHPLAFDDD